VCLELNLGKLISNRVRYVGLSLDYSKLGLFYHVGGGCKGKMGSFGNTFWFFIFFLAKKQKH
jgi:hypothetical protein